MSFHHSDVIPSFWCHSIILMSFHHSVLILTESFWLILSFWTHLQAIPTHSELKCRFCPNVLKISHSRPSPFRNGLIMRIISFRCHSSCCHWNDRAGLRMTGLTIEWQDGEGPGEAIPVQSPIIPASARHLGLIRKPLNHCGWGWNDKKFESEVLWFPFVVRYWTFWNVGGFPEFQVVCLPRTSRKGTEISFLFLRNGC